MSLPKLNVTIHETVLPSTDTVIKFRPFLVKEEKLLLTAMEDTSQSSMMNAIKGIINNCVQEKIDVDKLPIFDIEYLFLQLRAKSIGEKTKLRILCPDDEVTYVETEIDLDEIQIQVDTEHTKEIQLTDNVKIVMRYPQMKDTKGFDLSSSGVEQIFEIMKLCMWEIQDGDKVYNKVDISNKDLEEFVENFSPTQFTMVTKFFETMPKIRHIVEVTNPKTKVQSEVVLEGLSSFLE